MDRQQTMRSAQLNGLMSRHKINLAENGITVMVNGLLMN